MPVLQFFQYDFPKEYKSFKKIETMLIIEKYISLHYIFFAFFSHILTYKEKQKYLKKIINLVYLYLHQPKS